MLPFLSVAGIKMNTPFPIAPALSFAPNLHTRLPASILSVVKTCGTEEMRPVLCAPALIALPIISAVEMAGPRRPVPHMGDFSLVNPRHAHHICRFTDAELCLARHTHHYDGKPSTAMHTLLPPTIGAIGRLQLDVIQGRDDSVAVLTASTANASVTANLTPTSVAIYKDRGGLGDGVSYLFDVGNDTFWLQERRGGMPRGITLEYRNGVWSVHYTNVRGVRTISCQQPGLL